MADQQTFAATQPVASLERNPASTIQMWSPSPSITQGLSAPVKPLQDPMAVGTMLSPEEEIYDNFNHGAMPETSRPSINDHRSHNPPTPPVSPPSNTIDQILAPQQQKTLKDPILFPTTGVAPSNVGPLFVSNAESLEKMQDRVVDEHMASRPADFFRETSPPKREDYTLALWFKSNTVKMFSENPRGWLQKERELLRQDRKHAAVGHSLQKIIYPAPSKPSAPRQQVVRNTTSRVQKPPKAPKIKSSTVERFIRATTAPRSTARHSPMTTPEPRARTVAPNREDKDFNSLEDLSPPLYTLPSKPNSLKVDWKGNPLDLSKDPHASLLHPDELLLAAGLRLDCATYLTSKRRIFIRRRECAQIGKEFRKTDAQQACKIDVNKASKLWTAYDRVGWLDMKYIKMHMFQ